MVLTCPVDALAARRSFAIATEPHNAPAGAGTPFGLVVPAPASFLAYMPYRALYSAACLGSLSRSAFFIGEQVAKLAFPDIAQRSEGVLGELGIQPGQILAQPQLWVRRFELGARALPWPR